MSRLAYCLLHTFDCGSSGQRSFLQVNNGLKTISKFKQKLPVTTFRPLLHKLNKWHFVAQRSQGTVVLPLSLQSISDSRGGGMTAVRSCTAVDCTPLTPPVTLRILIHSNFIVGREEERSKLSIVKF